MSDATKQITFEYDPAKLFDAIACTGDGGRALGIRIADILLDPSGVSFGAEIGLGAYGITIKEGGPTIKPFEHTALGVIHSQFDDVGGIEFNGTTWEDPPATNEGDEQ